MNTTDNALWIMLWNLCIILWRMLTDSIIDFNSLHRAATKDLVLNYTYQFGYDECELYELYISVWLWWVWVIRIIPTFVVEIPLPKSAILMTDYLIQGMLIFLICLALFSLQKGRHFKSHQKGVTKHCMHNSCHAKIKQCNTIKYKSSFTIVLLCKGHVSLKEHVAIWVDIIFQAL